MVFRRGKCGYPTWGSYVAGLRMKGRKTDQAKGSILKVKATLRNTALPCSGSRHPWTINNEGFVVYL